MPRLSVVILALGRTHTWEQGLVSVLENRPRDCEVLVALQRPYDNPYRLEDEVRFVSAPAGSRLAELANAGVRASRAPIVHLLRAGVEVQEGWADLALRHFADSQVAAVAPTILDAQRRRHVLSAGLDYGAGGSRIARATGKPLEKLLALPQAVTGPSATAAFYRRDDFERCGGFEPSLGDRLCDIDLGVRLTAAGLRTVFDPAVHVYAPGEVLTVGSGYAAARQAARLFWRSAAAIGWTRALALRMPTVVGRFLGALPSIGAFGALAGEVAGAMELPAHRRHHRRLRELAVHTHDARPETASHDGELRIDGPHHDRGRSSSRATERARAD